MWMTRWQNRGQYNCVCPTGRSIDLSITTACFPALKHIYFSLASLYFIKSFSLEPGLPLPYATISTATECTKPMATGDGWVFCYDLYNDSYKSIQEPQKKQNKTKMGSELLITHWINKSVTTKQSFTRILAPLHTILDVFC